MEYLVNNLLHPQYGLAIGVFCILHYYFDAVFFRAALPSNDANNCFFYRKFRQTGFFYRMHKKNSRYDLLTSRGRFVECVFMIGYLLLLTYYGQLSVFYLILYYIIFIFMFAFCYELLDWHTNKMISNVDPDHWISEWKYVLISIQTQTTLGYTTAKPKHLATEVISVVQVLLGLFFTVIFIAQAVGNMSAKCPCK